MKPATLSPSNARLDVTHRIFFLSLTTLLLFLSGCTKEGPEGPQGPPGTLQDHLSDPAVQPKVIFTYPSDNTTGPFEVYNRSDEGSRMPHFTLRFNKLISKASVKRTSVSVRGFDKPVVAVLYSVGYYGPGAGIEKITDNELFSDLLSFRIIDSLGYYYPPANSYSVGRLYTITVDSTLIDINGNHVAQRMSFSFRPEPSFRVLESYPRNGILDAEISSSPSITFNSGVDTSIFSSLQISPLINGSWKLFLYDSAIVTLRLRNDLPFNTIYTMNVTTNAKDVFGNPLAQPYTSTFSTTRFRVTSVSPFDGSNLVPPYGSSIYVYLSGPIDTGTVRPSFTVNPPLEGALNLYSGNAFSFSPRSGFVPSTSYTVTISSALQAIDGTHLASNYDFAFTTDQFRVTYLSPDDGWYNVPGTSSISVGFNSILDTGSVRLAFSINPSVAGRFDMYDGGTSFTFVPDGPLAPNTSYTVTISTGIRTKDGHNLLTPYTFSFTTAR